MATFSTKMDTVKSVLSTLGSIAATTMVARSIINDFLPRELHDHLFSNLKNFFTHRFSSLITLTIDEFQGLANNRIFEAAEIYLGSSCTTFSSSSASSSSAQNLKVSQLEDEAAIQTQVDRNEEVVDDFEGVKFQWVLRCHYVEAKNYYNPRDMNSTLRSEVRSFRLTFHKKAKDMAIHKYLPHILKQAELLKQATKTIKLFTTDMNMYGGPGNGWSSVNLNHPATFETLAMDMELKQGIIEDLERFVKRKEYYRRVGKAWKRGYLLYGPPGTGKSSLIAAMANYLNFDIYDLELSGLRCDSDLRMLLLGTANRSILVVEDIDCSIELQERNNAEAVLPPGYPQEKQVTLSGLLNFVDGLWSSCGDERIIIFTTNHKEKLDQALLRPGRMDMHIHMSYCTPCGFKILVKNYLGINHHPLFVDIERLIKEVEITPAEVAEQLMKHDQPNVVLQGLVDFLNLKKKIVAQEKEAMAQEEKKGKNDRALPNENDVQGRIQPMNWRPRMRRGFVRRIHYPRMSARRAW